MNILIIGAGAWGTALAVAASAQHAVTLWSRDAQQVAGMQSTGHNARYLPSVALPKSLRVTNDELATVTQGQDLIIIATPMAGLRACLTLLEAASVRVPVAWLCKGFEAPQDEAAYGLLGHEIARIVAPSLSTGALSGPSFAQEVAAQLPTALVAASPDARVVDTLVQGFHSDTLRVYGSDDWVAVEVGGAVKNVLAIATGLCDGLALGLNARAALITRGLAEMARLGVALGARPESFMGLSGLGDLVLTATGDLSRNRQVGLQLATGRSLDAIVADLGHVAEGVYSARTVVARAAHLGVDMPISQAVVALLDGSLSAKQALAQLMQRPPTAEV
ncbi:MAG: NAD(P)-dependent glycerol-3-phosphate dehydrogenase [Burkholderiaceae bacterium]|nr:NAD(P)-dependent glycerol-3-phosphate dehydrogenase [Burkholderiaceae bacterium]